mgnify:CR=1 FL=1
MSGGGICVVRLVWSETDVTDSLALSVPSADESSKAGERWLRTVVVGVVDAAALDHEVVSIIAACRLEITQRLRRQLPARRSGIPSV